LPGIWKTIAYPGEKGSGIIRGLRTGEEIKAPARRKNFIGRENQIEYAWEIGRELKSARSHKVQEKDIDVQGEHSIEKEFRRL